MECEWAKPKTNTRDLPLSCFLQVEDIFDCPNFDRFLNCVSSVQFVEKCIV